MKFLILLFSLFWLLVTGLPAQRMDRRPIEQRKADYEKFIEYRSGFTDANTRASADTLLWDERQAVIDYSPLCDFKQITLALTRDYAPLTLALTDERPPFAFWERVPAAYAFCPLHNCRRGFIATWTIRDGRLYLKDIRLWTADRMWQAVLKMPGDVGEATDPPRGEIIARLEKAIGRQFGSDGLIAADWFTGMLLGETIARSERDRIDDIEIEVIRGEVRNIRAENRGHRVIPLSGGNRAVFFDEAQKAFNNPYTTPVR